MDTATDHLTPCCACALLGRVDAIELCLLNHTIIADSFMAVIWGLGLCAGAGFYHCHHNLNLGMFSTAFNIDLQIPWISRPPWPNGQLESGPSGNENPCQTIVYSLIVLCTKQG